MTDQMIRQLVHEVADGVEPGDRLDAIRAATGRRTHRGWWVAGGAALVAASVVTALALTTGDAPQTRAPDPASPAPGTTAAENSSCCRTVPVYFVGDTPAGPRLYRELNAGNRLDQSAETFALNAAMAGDALDPDYRSPWPEGSAVEGYLMATESPIRLNLVGDVHDRPDGMTAADARLAVEQVVRTAQAVFDNGRLPVRFLVDNQPTDQVLGLPASDPINVRPDLDVLAHVSLTTPSEGQVVDNDGGLVVEGMANSFEGTVVIRLQRWEGTAVVAQVPTIAGSGGTGLFPFIERINVFDVPPGDYVVIAQTDDPSGAGMVDTDTRRITIVD